MKYLILFFMLPFLCKAQDSALVFAEDVFAMCVKNDEKAFESAVPDIDVLKYMLKEYAEGEVVSDERVVEERNKNVQRALKGFRYLQQTAKELELDLSKLVITKKEALDKECRWHRNGKNVNIPTKEITFFFTCNGKKFAFKISDAIHLNGRWYVGYDPVAIHWLD